MTVIFEPTAHDKVELAIRDARDALAGWRLWTMMGWHDVLKRYRRSVLGPFWLTISMAVLVASLSAIYGNLLRVELESYVVFLAAGLAIWTFVSTTIIEGCFGFLDHEGLIKNIRMPVMTHAFRVVWRNLIIFAHNIVVFIAAALIFDVFPGPTALLALPGLAALCLNLAWVSLFFGILCTRFRDVSQIVGSLSQLLFFVTPVMWRADLLGERAFIVAFNPLHHAIEVIRAPLLGTVPTFWNWAAVIAVTLIGWAATFRLFAVCRARVVYWL
jgi:lipopolysaccharide transport system permease protein